MRARLETDVLIGGRPTFAGARGPALPPAFYTPLFAYLARLEFAHLCIPLLPCTPAPDPAGVTPPLRVFLRT